MLQREEGNEKLITIVSVTARNVLYVTLLNPNNSCKVEISLSL